MPRLLVVVLLLVSGAAVQAQGLAGLFERPALWASASGGVTWAPPDVERARDPLATGLSLTAASGRWMVQTGVQVSHAVEIGIDLSGAFDFYAVAPGELAVGPAPRANGRTPEARPVEAVSFRTLYVLGGPWTASRWFMGGVAAGPALSWGRGDRFVPPTCTGDICTAYGGYREEGYVSPGLAASVQGFVRLDGRVWVGGETMAVANAAGPHVATRLALRVDLLRPGR